MKEFFKSIAENVPSPLGRLLSTIPMHIRLGKGYSKFLNEIASYGEFEFILAKQLEKMSTIIRYSQDNIPFYHQLYAQKKLTNLKIGDLKDIELFPVVTKELLQSCSLEERSNSLFALKRSNTGGTTGQPLDFYIEKQAYAREWAHMHTIWATLGYRYTDQKITLRGKNIGNVFYKYNFNQNEYLINTHLPLKENIESCRKLILENNFQWIHGYPSSIYSFLQELEAVSPELFESLIKKVKGVFLGSEYPSPNYRNHLEKHCGLKTISWYGHSEMAVLATEQEPGSGVYYPFHSYGFAEAVPDGDTHKLIATSFHNFASPFIRYDTGDLIEPVFNNGLLESFRIKEGRNSDYVIDKNGRSISLTGLIFGRHHKAFGYSDHIQVKQLGHGSIEILITSKIESENWSHLFDFTNTFFDIRFTQINTPIRSKLGKVPLLVR